MWLEQAETYVGRTIFIIIRIVFFVFFIRFFVLEFGVVSGPSMEPRFRDGQPFMVMKLPFFVRSPERFEAVQFISPENEQRLLIKRVLGLPGERVTIRRNHVCVQSPGSHEECFTEPYLQEGMVTKGPREELFSILIPSNSYFLLGDNRLVSFDSRELGPIRRQNILGLVFPL